MDEKKYKLICVRKGKTNYARTNNRKNVTLGSYICNYYAEKLFGVRFWSLLSNCNEIDIEVSF